MKRESAIEQNIVSYSLERYRVGSIKLNVMSNAGYPDRLFLFPRRPTWLEIKKPGEEPTPLQYTRLQELEQLGYTAAWVDNEADGRAFVDRCATLALRKRKDAKR